jgi:uncharacterized protein
MTAPGSDPPRLRLTLMPGRFAVARLAPDAPLPEWATRARFWSVTRTAEELSVVCAEADVPAGVLAERGWRALAVAGPIPFSTTGVLASLAAPIAAAGISLFAIATYDTDIVLVADRSLAAACAALERAGHRIELPADESTGNIPAHGGTHEARS